MEVNLLKKEKTEMEFEIVGEDSTLPELLVHRLNEMAEVETAAYKAEHPLLPKPKIYIKVKKGDPVKAVEKAIASLTKDVAEFRGLVSKLKA
ncbi:MAG: DNA-directed RNA polymerase subunit L [bacterium]|nr:DNA-directed RNA polymerase subunit L [bacterium]